MANYIFGRLLSLVPVLFFISIVTFGLMHAVQGGPWDSEKKLPDEVIQNLNRRYGLEEPVWRQYLHFVSRAVQGDLGVSFERRDAPVSKILFQGLRVSAVLGTLSLATAVMAGVSLGVVAAVNRNRWPDYAGVAFASAGSAVPSFCLAVFLVYIFSVRLHWLPVLGWGTAQQAVLPVVTLAVAPTAYLARLTRASMLEVLHGDYIRTATAKGIGRGSVILRHGLRSAAVPLITALGPISATLLTGDFIVERMYSIPGSGRMFVQAVFARDYGMIMGTTLFFAVAIAIANLAVDIACAAADPRIRAPGPA